MQTKQYMYFSQGRNTSIFLPLLIGFGLYSFRISYLVEDVNIILNWLLYSLPDGLWLYSFLSAIYLIWQGNLQAFLLCSSLITVASLTTEFLQALNIMAGTFDEGDLLAYTLAAVAVLFQVHQKHHATKQPQT